MSPPLWVLSLAEEGGKADVAITLTPGRAQCIFIVLPAAPGDVSVLLPGVFLLPSPRAVQCTPMVSPGPVRLCGQDVSSLCLNRSECSASSYFPNAQASVGSVHSSCQLQFTAGLLVLISRSSNPALLCLCVCSRPVTIPISIPIPIPIPILIPIPTGASIALRTLGVSLSGAQSPAPRLAAAAHPSSSQHRFFSSSPLPSLSLSEN